MIRGITVGAVVLIAALALIFHLGTGSLSSFGWDEIAYICPLGSIEAMLGSRAIIVLPLIVLLILFVVSIILGKVFCGWICPIPSIRRFFTPRKKHEKDSETRSLGDDAEPEAEDHEDDSSSVIATVTTIEQDESQTEIDAKEGLASLGIGSHRCDDKTGSCANCGIQRKKIDSRHVVLGGALVSAAVFGFPVFCIVCPVGLVFATIVAWWRFIGFSELSITLVLFPIVIILEVVLLRKWCAKFCPIGAIMSLMSIPNRLFRPHVDEELCLRSKGIECDVCHAVCEEGLDPHYKCGMQECTKCGECKQHCPTGAISFPLR